MTYLDNAATMPLSDVAHSAWLDAVAQLRVHPGNPSALHSGGRFAKRMLEDARERVGTALGAERTEVIFTSGATESDALGVLGAARWARSKDAARTKIVVSAVEHDAVAEQRVLAEADGFSWEMLPVDSAGVSAVTPGSLGDLAVASLCWVSAETGIIQPVEPLVAVVGGEALVHTDAAQAIGHLPVDFSAAGADLLTVGGHKIGAPVGIGALLVRRGVEVVSDRQGGGHERKFRSGTVDVAGAVAFAAALEEASAQLPARVRHYRELRQRLIAGLPDGVRVTSDAASSPSIVHLTLDTAHPEILLMVMDRHGVMVSAGSACHAGVTRPSEILLRMGRSEREALGVLRVSLGPANTPADIDRFLAALPESLAAAGQLDRRD